MTNIILKEFLNQVEKNKSSEMLITVKKIIN